MEQKFYFKNGFVDTKYKLVDSGNIYDVLYKGNNFSKSEYEKLLKTFSFGFIKNIAFIHLITYLNKNT